MRRVRPALVWSLGFALAALGFSFVGGCDVDEIPERAELGFAALDPGAALGFTAANACENTCSAFHCELVIEWRDEAIATGSYCEVACRDTELDCIADPPEHCGWCGLDAHDCVEACDAAIADACEGACDAELCESVARDLDRYAYEGRECEADCTATMLGCLSDAADEYGWCGTCEHDAAVCRSGC